MKLIVSDFDGTFFDDDYLENIKFIQSLDNNYDFIIATGRYFDSLQKDLKIDCDYYICNDGGYILDKNKNVIYKNHIDSKTINIIYTRMLELGYNEYFFDYVDHLDTELKDNVNKLSIKVKDNNSSEDLKYMLHDLNDVYGYKSTNWLNIINIKSKKENAIDIILKLKEYEKIYVIGNEINDYGMLKKYNGYLITNKKDNKFNTLKNFFDLKKKL